MLRRTRASTAKATSPPGTLPRRVNRSTREISADCETLATLRDEVDLRRVLAEPERSLSRIQVDYLRESQLMLVHASLAPLLAQVAEHQARHALPLTGDERQALDGFIAGLALHGAVRPIDESVTWTIAASGCKITVELDNRSGAIRGRVFPGSQPKSPDHLFHSASVPFAGSLPRSSVVTVPSPAMVPAIEAYYEKSEQRPARLFALGQARFALLLSHPDYEAEDFGKWGPAEIQRLITENVGEPVETRTVRWQCTCSQPLITGLIAAAARQGMDVAFGAETEVAVVCPRCAAGYRVSRAEVADFLAGRPA